MAGTSQTCNHVAAALFRIKTAVRIGLNSPSCTSKPCSRLPNNKKVVICKKRLETKQRSFWEKKNNKNELNCSPKIKFDPAHHLEEPLSLQEIRSRLKSITHDSMVYDTEVKKEKVSASCMESENLICTLECYLLILESSADFFLHIEYFRLNANKIEKETRRQSINPLWFLVRKHMITASKAHALKPEWAMWTKQEPNTNQLT